MPSNSAAWLDGTKPLEVRTAPYTSPRDNEIVIKNAAIAINPVDWMKQHMGSFLFGYIKYPFVMGSDTAGEVVEIGRGVTRFQVGDRVVGHAVGQDEKRNTSAEGSFQLYTVVLEFMTSPIPSSMSYELASVIPLGLSTAACGLFEKGQLGLPYPSARSEVKSTGKTVIIWSGASSVGSCAVQLASAAGFEVISTSSAKNFEYVKKLGASHVFDYKSPTIVTDIIRTLKESNKCIAGAMSIGVGSADLCLAILRNCKGDKALAMATYPMPQTLPTRFIVLNTIYHYLPGAISIWLKSKLWGVRSSYIFGTTLIHSGVGKAIYEDYLPGALASGEFVPAPEPYVVGKGLQSIQAAFDVQKKGVSAKKVVVSL